MSSLLKTVKSAIRRVNGFLRDHPLLTTVAIPVVLTLASIAVTSFPKEPLFNNSTPAEQQSTESEVVAVTREQQVDTVKVVVGGMYIGDIPAYLRERIPKIGGGLYCDEFVDLLSHCHTSERDSLIVRLIRHVRDPDECMRPLLDQIFRSDRPRVARAIHDAIDGHYSQGR